MDKKLQFSREDYMQKKCTHRQYYSQFVTERIKAIVRERIGLKALMASEDEYLNDIQLGIWDRLPFSAASLSYKVCTAKEAARQIIEEEINNANQ